MATGTYTEHKDQATTTTTILQTTPAASSTTDLEDRFPTAVADGSLTTEVFSNDTTLSTNTSEAENVSGCLYEGVTYPLNTRIKKWKFYPKRTCTVTFCNGVGEVVKLKLYGNCRIRITTTTTLGPPTIEPFTGCKYRGGKYERGEVISKWQNRRRQFCALRYCDETGHVLYLRQPKCKIPTTTTTENPTMMSSELGDEIIPKPSTTTPSMARWCYWRGRYYPPGKVISKWRKRSKWNSSITRFCTITYCDTYGKTGYRRQRDNCRIPESLLIKPVTPPPTSCTYRGQVYALNSTIDWFEFYGQCRVLMCTKTGDVKFELHDACPTSTTPTVTTVSPPISQTVKTSTHPEMPPYSTVSDTTTVEDKPFASSTSATAVEDEPSVSSTSATTVGNEPPKTTLLSPALGCHFKGEFHLSQTEISRKEDKRDNICYGKFCNEKGKVEKWENTSCFTYRIDGKRNEAGVSGCSVDGKYYPRNSFVPVNRKSDCLVAVCEPGNSPDWIIYWNTCAN